ncbi:hypothetical protein SELMODRAFT_185952 [Selaginella moellendorffii]|uniref:non-specific serine/threonine protein kinase n=1 Tax=Selaginella moellendorffii TaxID=88036 RepID=D8T6Q4_SELML|nr:hypothetical protein SELMODRAFT_185952 [Selaginella moellendorffii]
MGCSFSGLNALYEAVSGAADIWINQRRFRIVRQLGEGGFAFVYLAREIQGDRPLKQSSQVSDDGLYAVKKVLIQSEEQLALVKREIQVSSLFKHPNLLPLLEHSMIAVKQGSREGTWNTEAYLLFPVYPDGTLQSQLEEMRSRGEFFPAVTVLHIFQQICQALKQMHKHDPSYSHNDVKPGNVLLSKSSNQDPPKAVVMDFGSATLARKRVRSRSEALAIQEWAAEHCSAPYRAPELWDCPSIADIDERVDVWSLGCTLFAIMYCVSPFEHSLGEAGGSLQLASMSGQIKWPSTPPYPRSFHKLVSWMVEPRVANRPDVEAVIAVVTKMLSKFPEEVDSSVF